MDILYNDNEFRSYLLGLFVSDGCLYYSQEKHYPSRARSEISLVTPEPLKFIHEKLPNLTSLTRRSPQGMGKLPVYRLSFYKPISQWFESIGFIGNKTGNEFIPSIIQPATYRHFVRGYSDGDGCFTTSNNGKYLEWSTGCMSKEFLISLSAMINDTIHCSSKMNIRKRSNIDFYEFKLGHEDAVKFGYWIYKDASLYIPAKYKSWYKMKDIKTKVHRWNPIELQMLEAGIKPPNVSRLKAYKQALARGFDTEPFTARAGRYK